MSYNIRKNAFYINSIFWYRIGNVFLISKNHFLTTEIHFIYQKFDFSYRKIICEIKYEIWYLRSIYFDIKNLISEVNIFWYKKFELLTLKEWFFGHQKIPHMFPTVKSDKAIFLDYTNLYRLIINQYTVESLTHHFETEEN